MQRNFEPMRKQVEAWQSRALTEVTAKVVIYEAFAEGKLEAPKHLARTVHDLYFEPKYHREAALRSACCQHLPNAVNELMMASRRHRPWSVLARWRPVVIDKLLRPEIILTQLPSPSVPDHISA